MKIVYNAGHGYQTAGKRFDGLQEYDFNRAVCQYAKEITEDNYEGVQVLLTHSDKRDVPLKERTDTANKWKADVWVGVHANAFGTSYNSANGIETYIYGEQYREARELAELVQDNLVDITRLRDRGVKVANLHEVRETHMPAILVECGFMTNKAENMLLRTESYRLNCATAIVESLAKFYKWKLKPRTEDGVLYKVIEQKGAFAHKENADKLAQKINNAGGYAYVIKE
jgi:N-acetylmuramoyl-L-alanine amidase